MEKGVITIDYEAIIRSVNQTVVSMFGYRTPTDLIGKSLNLLLPSPYKEQHDSFLQNYRRTGEGKIIGKSRVVEGLRSDGVVFPIRICVTELKVGDQKIFCGLIEKLRDDTGLVTIDESGIITSLNSQLCNIFGYTKKELLGQNISIIADSPHDMHHDEYIKRYLKTGEARVLNRVRNLTGKHKDGSPIVISLEVSESKKDGNRIFNGRIRQITEEMEALVTIDINGIIRSVNQNLWTTFGYKEDELVGKNVKILMPHPHRELHDNYLKRYARTRQKRIIGTRRILKAKHKDGSMFYIYLEVNEFEKDGETLFGGKVTRVLKQPAAVKKEATGPKYIGNYVVQKTLVDGLYGKVKLALHQLTQERVIIKVIERTKIDQEKFREIAIMRKLRHPNIVRLLEVIESTDEIYIVIEYIGGGELFDYALDRTKLSEEEARKFWRQMVQGVQYMHDCRVVHRDLKLENIMLDEEGNVVIIDMGLSNFISEEKMLKTFCGSTSYAAPEMFLCHDYKGPEVDVWSLGVILYCLVLGYLPFEDPQHIIDADPIPPEDVSSELCDLFAGIFKFEPSKRLTMEQLRVHPWTNKTLPVLERTKPESMLKFSVDESHLKQLEAFGFEHKDIVSSISKGEFNQITSSLFLLEKKERLATLKERKEKEDSEKKHHKKKGEKEKSKDKKEKKKEKEKSKEKKEKKEKKKKDH